MIKPLLNMTIKGVIWYQGIILWSFYAYIFCVDKRTTFNKYFLPFHSSLYYYLWPSTLAHPRVGFRALVPSVSTRNQTNKAQKLLNRSTPITPLIFTVFKAFTQSQIRETCFKTKHVITSHLLRVLLRLKKVIKNYG